jgi:hypothetical protein
MLNFYREDAGCQRYRFELQVWHSFAPRSEPGKREVIR